MKKILLAVFALLPALTLPAQVFTEKFDPIEKGDTMLVGVFRHADSIRYNALMVQWNEIMEKEFHAKALQQNEKDAKKFTPAAANTEVARLEEQRAATLKEIDKAAGKLPAAEIAKMKRIVNEQFDQQIKSIPGSYADASRQIGEQSARLTGYDDSEFSNEKKYALKRRFAALAVDGKLHGYTRIRNFRHGRAAVCREVFKDSWGFIDETGREVVPCIYYDVNDFYNITQVASVFANRDDDDTQGWTTVWKSARRGLVQGMIDMNGNVKIPCNFAVTTAYQRIIFCQTPLGEFAHVCDAATGKYGIIDRQGNYTMPPTEKYTIYWYEDIQCFGYRTDDGKLVTFDAYGKAITK